MLQSQSCARDKQSSFQRLRMLCGIFSSILRKFSIIIRVSMCFMQSAKSGVDHQVRS